jgi:nitrogen fixation protein FixH
VTEVHHVTDRTARPLTGRTVLIYLLAFFGLVFVMNGVMIKLAIDTLPGTEVDSAYAASLSYNAEIRASHDQDARGWRVVGNVQRGPDGVAAIRVEARDARNVPLTGVAFAARLMRPADRRGDRAVDLSEREAGLYSGRASDVAPGQWDLVLEATNGTERLFLSRNRLTLQ